MLNFAIGVTLAVLIIIIVLWAADPVINAVAIGTFAAIAASACWSWFTKETTTTGSAQNTHDVFVHGGASDAIYEGSPEDTHTGAAIATPSVKTVIKDVLRNAKQGIATAASAVAIAGTGGMGGDTIVEVIKIILDATLWMGQIAAVFLQNSADYGDTLRKIYALDFSRGVNGIRDDMREIVESAGGPTSEVFQAVRKVYADTIEWLLSLLGTAISAAVPDDAGTVGWAFTEIAIQALRAASGTLFWIGSALYNSLPNLAQGLLEKPENLRDIATYAIASIEKYVINSEDDGSWTRLRKSFTRNIAISTLTGVVLLLNPILMFPVAGTIFVGGQLLNAFSHVLDNGQIASVFRALYEKKVSIPGLGEMTAVDAFVMFMQKITVLTFAGLYILSDVGQVSTGAPPADFAPPKLTVSTKSSSAHASADEFVGKTTPKNVAGIIDPTDKMISEVAKSA